MALANGMGEAPPAPLVRLQRSRGLWQLPDLEPCQAAQLLAPQPPGSFVVTGTAESCVLSLRTDSLPGAVGTYRVLETPAGVSLDTSQLSFPDLPQLLAFLSSSRDILPRTLLLPPGTLEAPQLDAGPGPEDGRRGSGPPQAGTFRIAYAGGALYVVNPLFLEERPEATEDGLRTPPGTRGDLGSRGKVSAFSLPPSAGSTPSHSPPPTPTPPRATLSPYRVSWIEGSVCSTPPEPDSLSLSSVEEEAVGGGEATPPLGGPAPTRPRRPPPASRVFHRLSAVGSALSGLVSAERRVAHRVLELAQEPDTYVGGLVQSFVCHLRAGGAARPASSTELLQEIRQLLSGLRSYLCASSELQAVGAGDDGGDFTLESAVEAALYKCVLKPLRDVVFGQLREYREEELRRLERRQLALRARGRAAMGVTAAVPDAPALERIQAKLVQLHAAYAPHKKVALLLKICKLIYEAMNQGSGGGRAEPFGADDFLPVLTYVLVHSETITATQLDVEYMMELLDPSQLQGEGGYYLTTWFGALYHIANFEPAMVTRQISVEAQHSISQWQRRRTIHPGAGTRRRSQDILYISFQEPFNQQRAFHVPLAQAAEAVKAACAQRFGVSDPETYGLYAIWEEGSRLLEEDARPQKVKAELLQAAVHSLCFVYRQREVEDSSL
ncbi:ras and Rab interactor-like protein [Ornithorhynchus anatinus]|uniref:ras and Rab interactor-like protein n=1 Tax=Ornithorhynchus anatinus TaxID=9258 RepID=UPI0019D4E984|nr:ras and Rab interactor-like protein [Ornithorhynchus anatinus]